MAERSARHDDAVAPCVVVIEDEPQIRRFLRASLGDAGYRLFEATTAAEGLLMTWSPLRAPPAPVGISLSGRGAGAIR